ncbi:uncharacterized protein DUF3618 [Georgenia soli]|uniref:Uncharacterized protein DUF3618 n=1 Tax=Georgenia soli TaxID=638953 RepID=A0A2A9EMP0_9MICO|nr:DUF3618 domain-containing protein [Georgenia soli]PFG40234.1 uncharacterized protein DUF3618 [Georgenia soli]
MSEDAKERNGTARKRTPAEIEADLAKTRIDLTNTVNELSDRLDPRAQVDAAKESAKAAANAASARAKGFKDDVAAGDPKTLGVLAAGLATAGIAILLRLRGR